MFKILSMYYINVFTFLLKQICGIFFLRVKILLSEKPTILVLELRLCRFDCSLRLLFVLDKAFLSPR